MLPGGIVEILRPAEGDDVRRRVSTASLADRAEVALDDIVMGTETDGAEDCAYVSVPALTMQLRPDAMDASDTAATTTKADLNSLLSARGAFLVFMPTFSLLSSA